MRRISIGLLVLVFIGAPLCAASETPVSPATQDAATSAKDALNALHTYLNAIQAKGGPEVIKNGWDWNTILQGVFGENLAQQTEADTAETKKVLVDFISKVMAAPEISVLMSHATFSDFKAQALNNGDVSIDYVVRLTGNDSQPVEIPNTTVFRLVGNHWLIIDSGVKGKMLVPALKTQFAAATAADHTTPLQYVRMMAESKEK